MGRVAMPCKLAAAAAAAAATAEYEAKLQACNLPGGQDCCRACCDAGLDCIGYLWITAALSH